MVNRIVFDLSNHRKGGRRTGPLWDVLWGGGEGDEGPPRGRVWVGTRVSVRVRCE